MKKTTRKPAKVVRHRASPKAEVVTQSPAPEPTAMAATESDVDQTVPDSEQPASAIGTETGGRAGLHLEPSCMLRDALDMQFQLLSTDFGSGDVLMDGSAVQRVDTAGLQLLVAFVQHHKAKGRRVGWSSTSEVLTRAADRLGLVESLHLPRAGECVS